MSALAKIRKVGGSLMVTIPSNLVKPKNLRDGDLVEIEVNKQKIDFFGAMPGIGPFTEEDRMEDRDL